MILTSKKLLKKMFPRFWLYVRVIKLLVKNENSYLHASGWIKSVKEQRPLSPDGNELPWMNYPIIAFLQERLSKELTIFEFGSGYSTLFFAKRAKSVMSVEYDDTWFQLINKNLPENAQIIFKQKDIDGEYCRVIQSTGKQFDVVVVDGRDRVNCIKQSIDALSDRGVILLDDSQREYYSDGINHAIEKGFSPLSFEGLKPTDTGVDKATILYRRNNCLNL